MSASFMSKFYDTFGLQIYFDNFSPSHWSSGTTGKKILIVAAEELVSINKILVLFILYQDL